MRYIVHEYFYFLIQKFEFWNKHHAHQIEAVITHKNTTKVLRISLVIPSLFHKLEGPILLTRIDINPKIDKELYPL